MNSQEAKATGAEVINILKAAQAEGKLQGLDIARAGGTYGTGGYTMKISLTHQRTDADRQRLASTSTPDVVFRGLATPGTPVWVRVNGGETQKGEIVKANRSRYVIKGNGGKYDGQEFTYPFRGTMLDSEGVPAA